jgi:hypothetical protein
MTLSQKHRSTIYQRLEPILGEEEAEALLAQFPGSDLDELATKELVRAEISDLRTEMHQLFNRMFVGLTGVMVGIAGVAIAIARS